MEFKCLCSFKINLKKKTKLLPLSNLCLPSSVQPWERQLDWHRLKLSFSSPGPGAPWDRPLPSAPLVPLRVSTPARGGASLLPSQVRDARAAASDHVSTAPQGASAATSPPGLRVSGSPGPPGPLLYCNEVEVTRIQCGLTADFGRKVTGVDGADFTVELFVS